MSYKRVLPRDLFNEAKLLKCLGQLALLIHDGKAPDGLSFEQDAMSCDGFDIDQDPFSGELYVDNLTLWFDLGEDAIRINLSTHYNSRDSYPLVYEISPPWMMPPECDDKFEGDVFDLGVNGFAYFSEDLRSALADIQREWDRQNAVLATEQEGS